MGLFGLTPVWLWLSHGTCHMSHASAQVWHGGQGEPPQVQVSSHVCMRVLRSTHAQVCVLNAICVGCSQTSPCIAGGFLPRKCKEKPLSHAGSHTSVYMQNQASICCAHSPPPSVGTNPTQLKAVEKPKRHWEKLGFSSPSSGLCTAAPAQSQTLLSIPMPQALPCS